MSFVIFLLFTSAPWILVAICQLEFLYEYMDMDMDMDTEKNVYNMEKV